MKQARRQAEVAKWKVDAAEVHNEMTQRPIDASDENMRQIRQEVTGSGELSRDVVPFVIRWIEHDLYEVLWIKVDNKWFFISVGIFNDPAEDRGVRNRFNVLEGTNTSIQDVSKDCDTHSACKTKQKAKDHIYRNTRTDWVHWNRS